MRKYTLPEIRVIHFEPEIIMDNTGYGVGNTVILSKINPTTILNDSEGVVEVAGIDFAATLK